MANDNDNNHDDGNNSNKDNNHDDNGVKDNDNNDNADNDDKDKDNENGDGDGATKKTMTMMNNDYEMTTSTMTSMTMTTTTTTTTMTTMMMTTKTSTAMMDNLAIIFYNIIMIIWAALGVNQLKYHSVSQLHPLDDQVLGVPALSANRHTRGIVYVRAYVRTQYDEKWRKITIGTILPLNCGQNIVHGSGW